MVLNLTIENQIGRLIVEELGGLSEVVVFSVDLKSVICVTSLMV